MAWSRRNILAIVAMIGGLGMIAQGSVIAQCPPHNSGISGPEYPCNLYLSNLGGQMFYAGIVVEILGLVFYRRFPPEKKGAPDREYRLEPMKIDDTDPQKDE